MLNRLRYIVWSLCKVLTVLLAVVPSALAADYTLTWRVTGHQTDTTFTTHIAIENEQRTITHDFPEGFSIQSLTGDNGNFYWYDYVFKAKRHRLIISPEQNGKVQLHVEQKTITKTTSLLRTLFLLLQSSEKPGETTRPAPQKLENISLGFIPVPVFPYSVDNLAKVYADNIDVSCLGKVSTALHIKEGGLYKDVKVMLEKKGDNYMFSLTHCPLNQASLREAFTQASISNTSRVFESVDSVDEGFGCEPDQENVRFSDCLEYLEEARFSTEMSKEVLSALTCLPVDTL